MSTAVGEDRGEKTGEDKGETWASDDVQATKTARPMRRRARREGGMTRSILAFSWYSCDGEAKVWGPEGK